MILNANDIFKNAFVVSIDNVRLLEFQKNFKNKNIPLPKIFTGYEIEDSYLLAYTNAFDTLKKEKKDGLLNLDLRLFHSFFNNASHFAIVQFAKILDLPFVTIFEDDAVPVDDCIEKLNLYCSDIPDKIDVLRIGYCSQFYRPTRECDIKIAIPHSDNLIVKNLSGSHAYIVFKRYYDDFIKTNKVNPRCDFSKINPSIYKNVFALKESLFNQINLKNRPVIHSYKLDDLITK